jgi:hypothetical protein
MSEHAVIYSLIPSDGFDFDELDSGLEAAAADANAEYDGYEAATDGSLVEFFLYGEDADALYDATSPVVQNAKIQAGSYAVKRYGGADEPDARAERIALN